MRRLCASVGVMMLAGCAAVIQPGPPAADDTPLPIKPAIRKGQSGGVFVPDSPWLVVSDVRVFRAGDVLTVTLDETTQASKKADTQFAKNSTANITPFTINGKGWTGSVGMDASRDFSGSSSSTQQNALQGAITVVVQEVLPNGLLRVQGEKNLYLNQGEELIKVSGYVRATDVDTENRVSSQRIANARIAYSGRGALADANAPGWLSRFFTSPWLPF